MEFNFDEAVGRIYEAALMPAGWTDVLDLISRIAGSVGSTIFTESPSKEVRWQATEGLQDLMAAFASGGWATRNSRGERTMKVGGVRFITEADLYRPDELANDPLHRDFLWPRGFGWGTGTRIAAPTGDTIVFSSDRRLEAGPVPQASADLLTTLRPHLARAALMAIQLGFRQAQTLVTALEAVGLPAAVLKSGQRLAAANGAFRALEGLVRIGGGDRLELLDPVAQATLSGAFDLLEASPMKAARTIPLRAIEGAAPMLLHLLPIEGTARDIFVGAQFLAFMTTFRAKVSAREDWLQGLFDLTPAEARVCRLIGLGISVEDAAVRLAVSRETIRKHLQSVFVKTGTNRQPELVAFMSSL